MRIVVAPDSFKESLSANEVALSIEKGIYKVFPEAEVTLIPMADGGEGTVQSLVDATGGQVIKLTVKDPLMRDIEGFLGILGAVNNGGIVLDWFAKNMVEGDVPISKLLNDAAKIAPGSDGLIFLPYLLGERAPIWDSQASGGYMGISIKHKQAHFLRAALEGVIFNIYQIGRALKEVSGEIHVIKANGGFAQSKLWLQILADVFNRKVYYSDIVDAPSVGAFLMALEALKISDWKEVKKNNKEEEVIVPNQVVHKTYQKSYSIFKSLYPNLKQDFAKIYQLKK